MSQAKTPPVPVGIQRLLRLAAIDPLFRAQLFEKRDAVARAAGVELTETERLVLRAASESQLVAMAEHLAPPPSPRRDFFLQTAATAAALLGGAALVSSEGCARGARPDVPPATDGSEPEPARPETNEMQTTGGAAPDEPPPPPSPPDAGADAEPMPPRPEYNDMHTKGGAAPDEPPPPKPPPVTRGISPDVPPKK